MLLAQLEEKLFKPFLQRPLHAVIHDIELTGKVDLMLATGKTVPRQPYFFFHEYKRKRGRNNDPLGQLLAEMIAAQTLNPPLQTLYGCYVLGEDWYFVVLQDKKYAVSLAFDASKQDIFQIVAVLRQVKVYIANIIAQAPTLWATIPKLYSLERRTKALFRERNRFSFLGDIF